MRTEMGIDMKKKTALVIVGGGPAGLAAAAASKKAGIDDILILERDEELGGILNQCIHNGFGLHTFKEELTGPEYAARYIAEVKELGISCLLNTIVVDIETAEDRAERGQAESGKAESGKAAGKSQCQKKYVTAMNREEGLFTIEADAVILAMGCRERSKGALNIPGYRPAGVYSAGTAQRYVNIEGRMPGKEVVILGSGDIGLIMARRMTLEGAKVKLVAELMPYSGGLKRNIVQCLEDYNIPLKLNHTVIDIDGKERVKGVTIAGVDENRKPIPGTEEYVSCDTLLLSCGLIPENELSTGLGVALNPATSGPLVNESLETNIEGVFACGNVLHVHDLVDYVSEEAAAAGIHAAAYIRKITAGTESGDSDIWCGNGADRGGNAFYSGEDMIPLRCRYGVRYTVPSQIRPEKMSETATVRFRVDHVYKDVTLTVKLDDTVIMQQKKRTMAPGEMEQLKLKKSELEKYRQEHGVIKEISVELKAY